jgi:hypothetical protein
MKAHPGDAPEPIEWRKSARGNLWACVDGMHIVIWRSTRNKREWSARITRGKFGSFQPIVGGSQKAAAAWAERVMRDHLLQRAKFAEQRAGPPLLEQTVNSIRPLTRLSPGWLMTDLSSNSVRPVEQKAPIP